MPKNKKVQLPEEEIPEDVKKDMQKNALHGRGMRGPAIKGGGAKNPWKTFKRLMGYTLRNNKAGFAIAITAVIVTSLVSIAGNLFLSRIIDQYIRPLIGQVNPDFSKFYGILIALSCIYIFGALCAFLYNRVMVFVAQGTLKRMRDEMFEHMQHLPLRFFDTRTHGDLMSCYTNDTDTMRQLLSQTIPQIVSSAVTVVGTLFAMLYYSVTLTLIMLVFFLLITLTVKKIGQKSARHFLQQQIKLGKLNGYIEEMIEGQKVVKVFCHEERAKEKFGELNEALCLHSTKANVLTNIIGPLTNNIGYIQYIVLAVVGVALCMSNSWLGLSLYGATAMAEATGGVCAVTIGSLISYLQLSRNFNMPVQQVTQQFNAIIMALAGAERIFEIVDTPFEDAGGDITLTKVREKEEGEFCEEEGADCWAWKVPAGDGTFSYVKLRGDIRFNNVTFGYNENKVVLKNISLYAKPGQKIAFVGATGAGKTTITNLINRFYDIQEGEILYDGLPIRSINKDDLRRSLGVVLQDTHLFTGTVMDNIRYGRLDATDEECIQAAKLANADFFIEHLPDGYQTMLTSDGANLSQGQRQLLAIARAMVSNCPVLILDEATSFIDTRTEKLIGQGLDKLMEGKTVFVIAHRLSTVRDSKAIMVLEHGQIIERGSHEQLIAQKGKYYQLYTGAFELE